MNTITSIIWGIITDGYGTIQYSTVQYLQKKSTSKGNLIQLALFTSREAAQNTVNYSYQGIAKSTLLIE